MRIYWTATLYMLMVGVRAGYFTSECVDDWYNDRFVNREDYDVTDHSVTIHSHVSDRSFPYNPNNYRSCMNIWTNRTDYVIKLEEKYFRLQGGDDACSYDYLDIYFTSLDNAETSDKKGQWCSSSGPGTVYSSHRHMFLYFYTIYVYREAFEFVVSSIHKDDVPIQLSAGAILGIVFGVVALIIIIIFIVACILVQRKRSGRRHATLSGPPAGNNQNMVVVSATNSMYNQQVVGGNVPPPTYQQIPLAYQTSYGMAPVSQAVGPPPPAKDTAYPPTATICNPPSSQGQLNDPPPAYKQDP